MLTAETDVDNSFQINLAESRKLKALHKSVR